MNRATTTHATHDELLIARLYGGDLDARQRARALAQVDACRECAALLAELGTIARETAALPAPPRPRDFSLTAADAARLGQPRRRAGLFGWQRARALGGSLAAIGFAGMAVIGTITMLAPATSSGPAAYTSQEDRQGLAGPSSEPQTNTQGGSSGSPAAGGCYGGVAPETISVCPSAGALAPGENTKDGQSMAPVSASSTPQATPSCCEEAISKPPSGGGGASGGLDARLIGLAGFAAVAGLGLVLLLVGPRPSPGRAGQGR
jgi:hypothetical protein